MTVKVLVERTQSGRFRASTANPFTLTSDAETKEKAINSLQELATDRLRAAELVEVDIPTGDEGHPWLPFAGVWQNHPDFDAYVESVEEYRRNVDLRFREGLLAES